MGEPKSLSREAAQAIYDKIDGYDAQIDKAMAEIGVATNQIVRMGQTVQQAYEKREELAAELGVKAAEDFTPQTRQRAMGFASAPFTPQYRFRRANPLPTAYATPFPPAPSYPDEL